MEKIMKLTKDVFDYYTEQDKGEALAQMIYPNGIAYFSRGKEIEMHFALKWLDAVNATYTIIYTDDCFEVTINGGVK